jgi:hypothetical protein
MSKFILVLSLLSVSCVVDVVSYDQIVTGSAEQDEVECSPDNGCSDGGGGGGGSCGSCHSSQECNTLCNTLPTPGSWVCQRTVGLAPGFCVWQ